MTKVTLAKNDFINLSLKGASIKSISSDKPSTVFVFKDKTIQGIKKGKATITVVDTAGREYFCTIKVEQPFLNEKSITLEEGQYYPLRLNGNTQKISWISKNEKSCSCYFTRIRYCPFQRKDIHLRKSWNTVF